jgi:GNAT superfamily N-acetyltransferase
VVSIRVAKRGEADALIAIDSVAANDSGRADRIRRWLKEDQCYVACQDGRAVAYAVLSHRFYDQGFIDMVMVDEPFRHKGLGTALIRYLISRCRTPKLWTSTNRSNRAMQRLLARLDFQASGIIENLDESDPEYVFFTLASEHNRPILD